MIASGLILKVNLLKDAPSASCPNGVPPIGIGQSKLRLRFTFSFLRKSERSQHCNPLIQSFVVCSPSGAPPSCRLRSRWHPPEYGGAVFDPAYFLTPLGLPWFKTTDTDFEALTRSRSTEGRGGTRLPALDLDRGSLAYQLNQRLFAEIGQSVPSPVVT